MEPWFESRPPSQLKNSAKWLVVGGKNGFPPLVTYHQPLLSKMASHKRNALKIFSGNAHPELAREIAACLGTKVGDADVGQFPDGEVRIQILENVRGADVFVVQPTCRPVNDNLVELLIMLDAFRRASADRITAVMPYYGYARQDRKDRPRVPISSKVVADLVTSAGASRVLALDLHAGQIQGYFNIPVDHLYATPVTVDYFRKLDPKNLTVVSPDTGGVERARAFAKRLGAPLAIIDKRREDAHTVEVMNVIGQVEGRVCLLVDDLIDTGGTIVRGARALREKGAVGVYACCVHGVFAGDAVRKLCDSPDLEQVVTTNSIPPGPEARNCGRIKVLSIASLIAEAIRSIHDETSVSKLFI